MTTSNGRSRRSRQSARHGHDEGGYDRYETITNDARVFSPTPENERALVAECAAMYRDGVKTYEADGWTPCDVTPECLEYWMRYRRGED